MSITETLSKTPGKIPIWFSVPAEFIQIDPTESLEDRVARLASDISMTPGLNPQQQADLIFAQEALYRDLAKTGAIYAAHCVASSEHNQGLVSALFTVIIQDLPQSHGHSLEQIARGLREPGSPVEVLTSTYPAGLAIAHGRELSVKFNGQHQTMRSADIMFMMPTQDQLAIFSISTSNIADWDSFMSILDGIAMTVSFSPPNESASSIGSILSGGVL
ncbi:hypothetical protein BJF85_12575 [Saccharomonospora sp. CUA-673]|uniref:hypothetical protein n=1 Tax=Saccharomonospora sp. CUA-673 TaxID=1904969 RepID=UPI0009664943|nr:hypothetical protein [Saccharomonospora sp. CUA-673]OLT48364.1 hypothetical protein BJF85_12575 [Saccharomonospora sp. CUA-673]